MAETERTWVTLRKTRTEVKANLLVEVTKTFKWNKKNMEKKYFSRETSHRLNVSGETQMLQY